MFPGGIESIKWVNKKTSLTWFNVLNFLKFNNKNIRLVSSNAIILSLLSTLVFSGNLFNVQIVNFDHAFSSWAVSLRQTNIPSYQ